MTRDRLSTFGKRISFRLQPAQTERLRLHELAENEPNRNIINRQLKRLRQAILEGATPIEPASASGTKDDEYQLLPERDVVEPFIQRMRKARGWKNDRVAVEQLVPWSCELPIVTPFENAEEMYQTLLKSFGHAESIPVRSALLAACDRCSLEQARTWLWELKESGVVKLRIPSIHPIAGSVVRLPDGRGKTYFYLDL